MTVRNGLNRKSRQLRPFGICHREKRYVDSDVTNVIFNGHDSVDDMLDTENKRLAENLATKVSRLKSLAYDIDREADDQNEYLDGMDSNFLSATGLLSGSVKRFSTMVRSGRDNRRILCYVSVGLVLVFFLLYYVISRIQR
ncbi:BET1-like protein isoform X1 [Pseudoliparis swirei]|uniref:BET1-like protein isoform X1 n=2 Tax=Pseudoliparis swirei TaxID=2059687 RepID=UPI0024BE8D20|nr:BET1-like protein isoform X1 [Pseudoliparis swirei]